MMREMMVEAIEARGDVRLCERMFAAGGRCVRYCLWTHARGEEAAFSITARLSGEQSRVEVGNDLFFAVSCFRRISEGGVLPSSLTEVFEDIQYLATN